MRDRASWEEFAENYYKSKRDPYTTDLEERVERQANTICDLNDEVDDLIQNVYYWKDVLSSFKYKINQSIVAAYDIRSTVLNSNESYEPNDVLDIVDSITGLFEELVSDTGQEELNDESRRDGIKK